MALALLTKSFTGSVIYANSQDSHFPVCVIPTRQSLLSDTEYFIFTDIL